MESESSTGGGITGTPIPDHPGFTETPAPAEPKAETKAERESRRTEYIILRIDEGEQVDGWPPLRILNAKGSDGQPVPVGAYSSRQAVRNFLIEQDLLEDEENGTGKFLAVPVRSFTPIVRHVERVTNDVMEVGQL